MFELSVLGGFIVLVYLVNILCPSDEDTEINKTHSKKKSNSKFYKK